MRSYLDSRCVTIPLTPLGVGDEWVHQGTVSQLRAACGYDAEGIRNAVINALNSSES